MGVSPDVFRLETGLVLTNYLKCMVSVFRPLGLIGMAYSRQKETLVMLYGLKIHV